MAIIEIKDLVFKYQNKYVYNGLDLSIAEGSWTTIIGRNGSGKSTLARLLVGLLKGQGKITIAGEEMNSENISLLRQKMGIVFENPDSQFISETVIGDLVFGMENLRIPRFVQTERLKEIVNYFSIDDLLNKDPHYLSGGEKQLIALASVLILEPEILILDEAFTMVDGVMKKRIYSLLKKIHRQKKITIINISHDIEDAVYGEDVALISNKRILKHDNKLNILSDEKLLKEVGFEPPFMANLSIKLKYYQLVDKVVFDMNEMVRMLWK